MSVSTTETTPQAKGFMHRAYELPFRFKDAVKRRIRNLAYEISHARKVKLLKGISPRERCFILGSGPSINHMDLTGLSKEFTFCLSAFFLHKDIEAINPKCYSAGDPLFLWSRFFRDDAMQYLAAHPSIIKVFDYDFSRPCADLMEKLKNTYFIRFQCRRRIIPSGRLFLDPTKELPRSDASTLIQIAIPLAVYMGFKKIYLLGCDCNYSTGSDANKLEDHFYKDSNYIKLKEIHAEARKEYKDYWETHSQEEFFVREYEIVKQSLKEVDVEVINAGVGGKLEVFKRISLDEVLRQ